MPKIKSPIVQAVKRVAPAVVSIVITKDLPLLRRFVVPPFFPFSPFGFNDEIPFNMPFPKEPEKKQMKVGGGSGFVVDEEGLVLTNRHVVIDPEAKYTVIDHEGNEHEAAVVARDPINDVAVLKIASGKLPHVELGDSSTLELGEDVIAIGNALGEFQNTVSVGVVSGLSRRLTAHVGLSGHTEELRGVIQTDAAINPGNSGGPLIDIEGNAVGVNTAIVMGAQNIGFAIPINSAAKVLTDLKKYGKIIHPFLGIRYIILNKELKERSSLPVDYGALVIQEAPTDYAVVPGSPADKAGIKTNDIILEFKGEKITGKNTLIDMIEKCEVGEEISIKLLRDNEELEVKTVLEERK